MIHTLNENDIPALLALSQSAGWEHTREDWRTLLLAGTAYGHRDESGRPVSSLVVTEFGPRMAALGMLIVCQKNRRLGLAHDLMRHAIAGNRPTDRPLVLVAGSKVEGFYTPFGFKTVERTSKLQAPPGTQVAGSGFADKIDLVPLDDANRMRMIGLDHQVHGYDRSRMLKVRLEQACVRQVALKKGQETLLGYGAGVLQGEQLLLGPVIGFNLFTAQEMAAALMESHAGPVRIDVPHQRRDFIETLLASGFEELDQQPIMRLNATELPGRRDHVFALTSQAWS